MVNNLGFIGEGDTEFMFLNSPDFKEFIKNLGFSFIGARNAMGRGNLEKDNDIVESLVKDLFGNGVEQIYFLTDLEDYPCITDAKSSIFKFRTDQKVIIISKAFEAWLLADTDTLCKILKSKQSYIFPESTPMMPFDEINKLFIQDGINPVKSKRKMTKRFLTHGLSIENIEKHQNCSSAKYFLKKLKEDLEV